MPAEMKMKAKMSSTFTIAVFKREITKATSSHVIWHLKKTVYVYDTVRPPGTTKQENTLCKTHCYGLNANVLRLMFKHLVPSGSTVSGGCRTLRKWAELNEGGFYQSLSASWSAQCNMTDAMYKQLLPPLSCLSATMDCTLSLSKINLLFLLTILAEISNIYIQPLCLKHVPSTHIICRLNV